MDEMGRIRPPHFSASKSSVYLSSLRSPLAVSKRRPRAIDRR